MIEKLIFNLVIIIGPLILAIAVHEFSHIAMARFLGDDLGTRLGRYTLDPLKHIDPVWTVALPVVLVLMTTFSGGTGIPFFAAGKPAPYNPMALNRVIFGKKITMRFGELLVAIAGPLSNLAMAFISLAVVYLLDRFGYNNFSGYSLGGLLVQFVYLNVALFVFNLIPIPPLDGSKVLVSLLPREMAAKYEAVSGSLGLVLFGLLIFGGGRFMGSLVRVVVSGMEWFLV